VETESQPSGSILEIQNVRKVFKYDIFKPKQMVIKNLSCSFPTGTCTGLLGHNGAGKTTTIRLILGLLKPDAGTISFEGKKISTATKAAIGYMPEVNKLPAGLTVDEVLSHHLSVFMPDQFKNKKERKDAVSKKIEEVQLTKHRGKKIGKLSKGMARRVAWAQATIHQPKLLILDEPSSGLDPLGRSEMLGWISAEKKRGTSIILCTHELAQISLLCDHFHLLKKGELVMTSLPESAKKTGPECILYDWQQKYAVHVSGLDKNLVDKICNERHMLKPVRIKETGMSAVLGFDTYESASSWVRELIDAGCVVLKFAEELVLTEDDITTLYRNEA
jgi:ABC-2 type transport system ATP-binding protein